MQDLIASYLLPIPKDVKKEEKQAMELKELRNQLSGAFLLINAIFVTVVFALQLNMDTLYVPWPCGDDMRVEPLGFVFMMVFGVIMIIQTIGMCFHRTSTFLHIMSSTQIACCGPKTDRKPHYVDAGASHPGRAAAAANPQEVQYLIELAKRMGRLNYEDMMSISSRSSHYSTWRTDPESALADGDDVRADYNNRRTVIKLDKKQRHADRRRQADSVSAAFQARFARIEAQLDDETTDIADIQRQVLGKNAGGLMTQYTTGAALRTLRERRLSAAAAATMRRDASAMQRTGLDAATGAGGGGGGQPEQSIVWAYDGNAAGNGASAGAQFGAPPVGSQNYESEVRYRYGGAPNGAGWNGGYGYSNPAVDDLPTDYD